MKKDYFDNVVLKLKRRYGKDELVSHLIKKLKEAEIEIGKLKSEIHHLEHELNISQEQREVKRIAKIEMKKNELYQKSKSKIKKQEEEIKELRKFRDRLISKS